MQRFGIGGVRAVITAALAGALITAFSAFGVEPTLRGALLRNQVAQEAALYETADGGRVFVLDRTREPPLLQYRGSYEVIALLRVPAARGDMILRDDTGEDLVRVTALGGVTLYPREHRTGLPASRIGPVDPLPMLSEQSRDFTSAIAALKSGVGGAMDVETPVAAAAAGQMSVLLADAARVTAEALSAAATDPGGHAKVALVQRIVFIYGAGASARLSDGVLIVELSPSSGYAGRPSSMMVTDALRNGG